MAEIEDNSFEKNIDKYLAESTVRGHGGNVEYELDLRINPDGYEFKDETFATYAPMIISLVHLPHIPSKEDEMETDLLFGQQEIEKRATQYQHKLEYPQMLKCYKRTEKLFKRLQSPLPRLREEDFIQSSSVFGLISLLEWSYGSPEMSYNLEIPLYSNGKGINKNNTAKYAIGFSDHEAFGEHPLLTYSIEYPGAVANVGFTPIAVELSIPASYLYLFGIEMSQQEIQSSSPAIITIQDNKIEVCSHPEKEKSTAKLHESLLEFIKETTKMSLINKDFYKLTVNGITFAPLPRYPDIFLQSIENTI